MGLSSFANPVGFEDIRGLIMQKPEMFYKFFFPLKRRGVGKAVRN